MASIQTTSEDQDVSIKTRLRKLEAWAPPVTPTYPATEAERGQIARALLRRLRWPDPFPDVADQEYVRHFSPWFNDLKKRVGQDGRIGA